MCADGADRAVRAADRGSSRPPYTVKAVAAHSMRRYGSRFGEHARHPRKPYQRAENRTKTSVGIQGWAADIVDQRHSRTPRNFRVRRANRITSAPAEALDTRIERLGLGLPLAGGCWQ
ncbi:hypothetical protein MGAST_02760 [Mycobacterium gastri 'Wayne']|uniref:Uncharacterized protein n=1 Tax=Mycobacterium gastri TaxID=1777 RepID=A0A1X1W2C7_MYCGS|nr:hypothetical protein MGAST_02760 [Mycobacterium gastri 'Wayne']ORV80726.1 hypothetical protein AWC07_21240 [Mycobacterium gastri]